MIKDNDYIDFMQEQGFDNKPYGVKIQIYGSDLTREDIKAAKKLRYAGYEAIGKIKAEINRIMKKKDPKTNEESLRNRESMLSCFDGPIYVEEIPNGYCKDWCCEHLPWFRVTTKVGHFVIGRRRSVISIDWSETNVPHSSEDLFPENYQSGSERNVHTDNIEQTKKYIKIIIDSI